ncbi:MAG: hypothetical protein JST48_06155 [Bacteroidetes bacterium]|nr:hypothetical protein [Bacteroidota bacterium]
MKFFISYILEFLAFFANFIALSVFCLKISTGFRYRLLCAYYLLASALIAKTLLDITVNNAHLYSILYVITGLSVSYYFYDLFTSAGKRLLAIAVGLCTLAYYLLSLQNKDIIFDSVGYALTSVGIVFLIFLYLHQLFSNITEEPLTNNFDFWFVCSQLIYHLGSFVIFLTYHRLIEKIMEGDYSSENRAILTYLWGIHNVLLFLGSLLTASGLIWILSRRKSQLS